MESRFKNRTVYLIVRQAWRGRTAPAAEDNRDVDPGGVAAAEAVDDGVINVIRAGGNAGQRHSFLRRIPAGDQIR